MRIPSVSLVALALFVSPQLTAAQTIRSSNDRAPNEAWIVLSVPGLSGEHEARVVGPANFAQQANAGTLRELELEVPAGALQNALVRAHRTRTRVNDVRLRLPQATSPSEPIGILEVLAVSGPRLGDSSARDKPARVKIDFQWKVEPGARGTGPGIESITTGTAQSSQQQAVGVQLAVADLLPLGGLQIGSKLIPWGQTATIPADQASAKQGGRCEYRYGYPTANQGSAASGPATNLVLLNAPNGAELTQDALPGLAAGVQHTSSGTLWLKPGIWTLYVHADGKQDVAEGNEQNNLQRVRVQVDGSCD